MSCQSQSRPWKKRQHQACSLELRMRRSTFQNSAFPRAPGRGCAWSQLPSRACTAWPCPSRSPGPPPLPVGSTEDERGATAPPGLGGSQGSRWADGLAGGEAVSPCPGTALGAAVPLDTCPASLSSVQTRGLLPSGLPGLRKRGSAGIAPALPGQLWPAALGGFCLWGWAQPAQG